MSDQFTRWQCVKCGKDGVDSWNKAMFDGVRHDSPLPDPWTLGMECQCCGWPCCVRYSLPHVPPVAVFSPLPNSYAYERDALPLLDKDASAGVGLIAGTTRDVDWSRGCLVAQSQLQ